MNLGEYVQKHLLGNLAGLQLLPQNADRWVRLSYLAAGASHADGSGRKQVTRSQIDKICNRQIEGGVVMMEDPSEGLFTQAIAGPEGSYIVLAGPTHGPAFELSVLMKAVVGDLGALEQEFQKSATGALIALLRLSDRMCQKAGLTRNLPTEPSPHGNVLVPSNEEIKRLARACWFDSADLRWCAAGLELPSDFWASVSQQAPTASCSNLDETIECLSSRPFLQVGDELVVLSPASFITAAIRVVTKLAFSMDCVEALAKAIHEVPRLLTRNFFNLWDWDLVGESVPTLSADGLSAVSTAAYRIGSDLSASILVCSDALQGEEPWHPDIDAEVKAHLGTTDLALVVVQSMGRFSLLASGGAGDDGLFLMLSFSDLETIFESEHKNQLCLFQFGRHAHALRERCRVFGSSTLDEYAFYIEHGHGFYFGDGPRPNSLSLMGDLGGHLRRKVQRAVDQHGVKTPDLRSVLEVRRLHVDLPQPIYGSPGIRELLVEAFQVPIWIASPIQEWERDRRAEPVRGFHPVVMEAVAYWLCDLAPSLYEAIDPFARAYQHIVIDVVLADSDSWVAASQNEPSSYNRDWIRVDADPRRGRLTVTLLGQALNEFGTADNLGERKLLTALVKGFRDLMPEYARYYLADDLVAEVVERHAPRGPKKMVLVAVSKNLNLLPSTGDAPRLIQEAEQELFLDELGDHLKQTFDLSVGEVPEETALTVLNEGVVGYAFRQLEAEVSGLSPVGLVEWLVHRHEAIIARIDRMRFETTPRIACYGPGVEEELREESKALGNADLALRFLIEYVSASSPRGQRAVSLRSYDRLLCLCSEIVYYGMESDLLRYGLGGIEVSFLDSGRLGIERSRLSMQQELFFKRFLTGEIRNFGSAFPRYWEDPGVKPEIADVMEAAEGAVEAEFGLSLTELNEGHGVLLSLAMADDGYVASMNILAVRDALEAELGWPSERIDTFLELLSLTPRRSFVRPPSPFRNFDVWPWRFNRRLSYLRRPLVKRPTASTEELIWSARSVRRSAAYFLDLLMDGRLPAHGQEQARAMSEFQSRLNHARGTSLERRVPNLFSGDDRFVVKRTIKRVAGEPVGTAGEIDCLVLDKHHRRIFVVECKDLLFAKTPYEMRQQLDSVQNSDRAKKTAVSQAAKKAAWIGQRVRGVLSDLGMDPQDYWMWTVHPVVMLDHEMFVTLIHQFDVPVVSLGELRNFILKFGTKERKRIS